MKHLKCLSYLIRHKYFVYVAGCLLRVTQYRLLVHDWTKVLPSEWRAYANYFYTTGKDAGAFDRAWLRHIHRNDHHWQHWVLREDSGEIKCLPIPEPALREMVADWMGAGRAINGEWEAWRWYQANKANMHIHPDSRNQVEALLMQAHAMGMA